MEEAENEQMSDGLRDGLLSSGNNMYGFGWFEDVGEDGMQSRSMWTSARILRCGENYFGK